MNERDFDLAELRSEQEREAGIEAAHLAISGRGRSLCECGAEISDYRRENFAAVRCIECQTLHEQEKFYK
jgi:RNA polymerase-binding transcription factor DksA